MPAIFTLSQVFLLSAHPHCIECVHIYFGDCPGRSDFAEGEECELFVHVDTGKHVRH